MHGRIQDGRLEGRESLAPPRVRALGRGLRAIIRPGAVVAPVRHQGCVEGVTVALHGVGSREEMAPGTHLRNGLDADLLGRGEHRLKELREHRQPFNIQDELLARSEEHTSELQSPCNLVCRLLLEKKKKATRTLITSSLPKTLLAS